MTGKTSAARALHIAQVVHEAMRAWQAANGQKPAPAWSRAPKWMKDASAASVAWRIENPDAPASAQHDQWMATKKADGWKLGKTKDGKKKTHPMMVAYDKLPEFEKRKDARSAKRARLSEGVLLRRVHSPAVEPGPCAAIEICAGIERLKSGAPDAKVAQA